MLYSHNNNISFICTTNIEAIVTYYLLLTYLWLALWLGLFSLDLFLPSLVVLFAGHHVVSWLWCRGLRSLSSWLVLQLAV